jgi:hypothetical protein
MCCRAMLRHTNEEWNLILRFTCQAHYLYYGCVSKCCRNHWRNVVCWSVRAEGADCLRLTLLQETNSHSALPKTTTEQTVNNNNNNNKYNVNVIKHNPLTLCKRKMSTSLSLRFWSHKMKFSLFILFELGKGAG